ncbi:unnamed protein product [Blepharisma stoltei]|uniref:Uncharacterized protein n=1 Tax=Blepharisma stoltei TaxID=1481888 RepID=A0AAU9K1G8_9CILI|nr:unnamed protein product [Blepharisma stoltei]
MKKSPSKKSPIGLHIEIKPKSQNEDLVKVLFPIITSRESLKTSKNYKLENILMGQQSQNIFDFGHLSEHKRFGSLEHDRIRELLKTEKKRDQARLSSLKPTRDISHIKDKQSLNLDLLNAVEFPTDLLQLKALYESSDTRGVPMIVGSNGNLNPMFCKKESCISRVLATNQISTRTVKLNPSASVGSFTENYNESPTPHSIDTFERLHLGNPTGRQDIENLWKWYNYMKNKYIEADYEDLESAELIYEMCSRELVRQVSVQCVERGDLLKELFIKFPEVYIKKNDKLKEEMNELRDKFEEEKSAIRSLLEKEISNINAKLKEKESLLHMEKDSKIRAQGNALFFKKKLDEFIHKYFKGNNDRNRSNYDAHLAWQLKKIARPHNPDELSKVFWKEEENKEQGNNEDIKENKSDQNNEKTSISQMPTIMEEIPNFEEFLNMKDHVECTDREMQTDEIEEELKTELSYDTKDVQTTLIIEATMESDGTKMIDDIDKSGMSMFDDRNNEAPLINENQKNTENSGNSGNVDSETISAVKNDEEALNDSSIGNEILNTSTKSDGEIPIKAVISRTPSFLLIPNESPNTSIEGEFKKENKKIRRNSFIPPQANNEATKKEKKNKKVIKRKSPAPKPPKKFSAAGVKTITEIIISPISSPEMDEINKEKAEEAKEEAASKLDIKNQKMSLTPTSKKEKSVNLQIKAKSDNNAQSKNKEKQKKEEIEKLEKEIKEKKKILEILDKDIAQKQKMIESVDYEEPLSAGLRGGISPINKKSAFFQSKSGKNKAQSPRFSLRNEESNFMSGQDFAEIIPEGVEISSWKAGFNTGYEKGRVDGFSDGEKLGYEQGQTDGYLQAIKEQSEENEKDSAWSEENQKDTNSFSLDYNEADEATNERKMSLYNAHLKKNLKKSGKESTKFSEFNFAHSELQNAARKVNPAPMLLQKFLEKKLDAIKKKSKMSRRMVNRIASSILLECVNKIKNDEGFEGLLEETYNEFANKYTLRNVGEKKFLEFVASLIKNSDFKRPIIYMRFIGCGKFINSHNYSKQSFLFYINCYQFMLNSKIGIVVGYDDSADKQMFPTARAIECIKESFEGLVGKHTITNMVNDVENNSQNDPKRINGNGLIELEYLLEIITENYEIYQSSLKEGVMDILSSLGEDKNETIIVQEFLIWVKYISPDRIKFEGNEIQLIEPHYISRINVKQNSLPITNREQISREELIQNCIEKNLLSKNDIKEFLAANECIKNSKEEIDAKIAELNDILQKMKSEPEKKWKISFESIFEEKLNYFASAIQSEKILDFTLPLKIIDLELNKYKQDFNL